mmetsp:Transcript_26625/g.38920  ORF Transcript_26625/g.38920 Transcript_26625/m.38920 type:complete len:211 (-) Transcript_26625:34-666(-)
MNTRGRLFRDTHAACGNLVPLVCLTTFQKTLDNGQNNLEFSIRGGRRIGKGPVLEEKVFGLLTLMNEESHITTIINNKIRSMSLSIILGPRDGIEGALPVLLKRLSLPGKDGSALITSNSSGSMILCRENVAGTPTDISSQFFQGFNQDSRLDRHVEGSRNTSSLERSFCSVLLAAGHETRHFNLSQFNILATIVGKRNVGNFVITSRHD